MVNMATSPTPASQPASTTPLVVEAPTSGPEVQSNQPINTAGQELNPNKRPPGNLAIGQAGGTRGITTWIYLAAGSLVLLIAISMTKSMVKQPDEPSLISQSMEDRNNG